MESYLSLARPIRTYSTSYEHYGTIAMVGL